MVGGRKHLGLDVALVALDFLQMKESLDNLLVCRLRVGLRETAVVQQQSALQQSFVVDQAVQVIQVGASPISMEAGPDGFVLEGEPMGDAIDHQLDLDAAKFRSG